MKWGIVCLLIALMFAGNVSADCANVRVRATNYNGHVATNYGYQYEHHQQTVVAIPVATFVPVPLYVANYVQPPVAAPAVAAPAVAAPAVKATEDKSDQILKLLKDMDTRIQALEKSKQVPEKEADPKLGARLPAGAEHKGLTILKKNCLACHESKVATDEGGGFKLFDGDKVIKLTDRQKLKTFKHIEENTMPKLDPKFPAIVKLTDPDASEVKDYLLKLN